MKGADDAKLWPIVQSYEISADEYRQATILGSKSPSTGIMMFTVSSVMDNAEHLEVMKSIYISTLK
jgi:hypothetical protein